MLVWDADAAEACVFPSRDSIDTRGAEDLQPSLGTVVPAASAAEADVAEPVWTIEVPDTAWIVSLVLSS